MGLIKSEYSLSKEQKKHPPEQDKSTSSTTKAFSTFEILLIYTVTLLVPWLTFFYMGRPFAGIFSLFLQISLLGWIPASMWAIYAMKHYQADAVD